MNVVFDFDGTLHNTAHLYGCAMRNAALWLKDQGYEPPEDFSDERMAGYLGVNAPDTWNELMPGLPDDIQEQVISKVGEEMIKETDGGKAVLYPGVPEMLSKLKEMGCRLFLLSNCVTAYMDAMARHFELDRWFTDFYPCEAYDFIPKEDIFRIIMEEYPDEQFVMVGDRESDIVTGALPGVKTVGCTYGFGEEGELDKADILVGSPAEIPAAIAGLQAQ